MNGCICHGESVQRPDCGGNVECYKGLAVPGEPVRVNPMAESSETWHEDSGRAFLCRCTDGLHDTRNWLHTGNPADRAQFLHDHEQARLASRYAEAISEIMAICGEEKGLSVSGAVLDQIEGVIAALSIPDTTEETA